MQSTATEHNQMTFEQYSNFFYEYSTTDKIPLEIQKKLLIVYQELAESQEKSNNLVFGTTSIPTRNTVLKSYLKKIEILSKSILEIESAKQ